MKTKITKTMLAFSTVATLLCSGGAVNAQTFTNGSLNGAVGSSQMGSGWTGLESPDTNDLTRAAIAGLYSTSAAATDSTDGGTWVGIHDRDDALLSGYVEGLQQTVPGLTIGATYVVSWEAANFGAVSGPVTFDRDGYIELALTNNGDTYNSPTMALGSNWHDNSYTFTASASTETFTFRTQSIPGTGTVDSFEGAYLSIDGISLTQQSVPEPSSALLLGLGGLGFLARRRR